MSNSLSHVFLFEIKTVKGSSMEIRDTVRVTGPSKYNRYCIEKLRFKTKAKNHVRSILPNVESRKTTISQNL